MAGLNPQVIGKDMPHGFAGMYARQPDMIVETRPAGGAANIPFGAPLVYDSSKNVVQAGTGFTAAAFAGVAGSEIKSALTYLDQQAGQYAPGEAVSVFQRGSINVKCYDGTPSLGGTVYVRTAESDTYTTGVVGGFSATNESGSTVALTNCQWGGPADANGIAELVILTRANA